MFRLPNQSTFAVVLLEEKQAWAEEFASQGEKGGKHAQELHRAILGAYLIALNTLWEKPYLTSDHVQVAAISWLLFTHNCRCLLQNWQL